jgi:hypothetical protein
MASRRAGLALRRVVRRFSIKFAVFRYVAGLGLRRVVRRFSVEFAVFRYVAGLALREGYAADLR